MLLTQRWILARLRHQCFFSLAELNAAIAPLLEEPTARGKLVAKTCAAANC